MATKKTTTARKLCSKVISREGVKLDGTLKKGFKYVKGGRVVRAKVATTAKRTTTTTRKRTTTKRKTTKKKSGILGLGILGIL